MSQKNFIIEVLEGPERKRTYIVRELSLLPNTPSQPVAVCESADELAQFFDNLEIK